MIDLRPPAPASPRLTYSLSTHARQRLSERTKLSEQCLLDALANGLAVQLNLAAGHFEGCVYELLFSSPDKQFFVAVTKPLSQNRGGIVVTVLTAAQHESDRGPIQPALLLQAALNLTSNVEFAEFAAAARDRLTRLVDTARDGAEGPHASALPVFAEGFEDRTAARGLLARAAKVLLDEVSYNRYCAVLAGQRPDSMRPNQVRVLVHYWDAERNAQCLRLSNPKIPQQHLIAHGLGAIHRHPAFSTWLAGKLGPIVANGHTQVHRIEAYLSTPHKTCEPVELDLDASVVDDPAPYPADFADSSPGPAAC